MHADGGLCCTAALAPAPASTAVLLLLLLLLQLLHPVATGDADAVAVAVAVADGEVDRSRRHGTDRYVLATPPRRCHGGARARASHVATELPKQGVGAGVLCRCSIGATEAFW